MFEKPNFNLLDQAYDLNTKSLNLCNTMIIEDAQP